MKWSVSWRDFTRIGLIVICFELALIFVIDGVHKHFVPSPPGLSNEVGGYYGHDFLAFYAAAQLTLSGRPADAYDTDEIHQIERTIIGNDLSYAPWVYPPTFLLFVIPFGLLPYVSGYISWSFSNITASTLAGWNNIRRWWTPFVVILFPAAWLNIFSGQNGGIIAGLMLGGLGLLNRQPVVAGVLLGLISYKPQFGILIPFALAAGRYWSSFIAAAISVVALAVAGHIAFGIDPWRAFFDLLYGVTADKSEIGWIAPALPIPSWTSESDIWTRSVTIYAFVRQIGLGPNAAALAQVLSFLSVASIIIYIWRTQSSLEIKAATLGFGVLLATPRAFLYDLVLLLVPLIFVLARMARYSSTGDWLFIALLWLSPVMGFFIFENLHFQIWPFILWAGMLFCVGQYRDQLPKSRIARKKSAR